MTKSTEERILYLIKARGALSAKIIGDELGVSPQAAQQHLAKLMAKSLVALEDRKHGRGRPQRFWHLTAAGHGRFPDRHSDLTVEILHSAATLFGEDGLEQLIRHREQGMRDTYVAAVADCTSLEDKVAALAEIRSREGYMAEWQEAPEGGFYLTENHCPICAAASACQGFCRSELEIFQAIFGADAAVERTEHLLAGSRRCAYRISRRS